MHLDPDDDNVRALLDRGLDGPVVMLNLLRFRPVADYGADPQLAPPTPITGREAYDRYVAHTRPFLEAGGGSIAFAGEGGAPFIGPVAERWDLVLLIAQTDIESFFAFADNPAYLAGLGHRTAALADSRLVPLRELDPDRW